MTATLRPHVRCAIYTRKSSEEGLEQSFNSLQAQREACEAFTASQRHEGWYTIQTPYDDGGFSGGTLDRPALQRLLDDSAAGLIDTVVVYKVDRLTRSLTDFARIIDIFDQKRVSFVSVTQQFNTTTSMGPADLERAAILRAIRTRGDGRENTGQDRRLQEERHVDGRHSTARVRCQREKAGGQS